MRTIRSANRPDQRRNRGRQRATALVAVTGLALGACGSGGSDDAATTTTLPGTTTTTLPVDVTVLAFCGDAESYLQVLNTLRTSSKADTVTIGDLKTAGEQAAQAATAANNSLDTLVTAIQEHAEADPATGATTTAAPPSTIAPKDVASAHLAALTKAQQEASAAIGSIADTTLVRDAGTAVRAAAFNLQLAWLALYRDAGCLAFDEPGAQALNDYVVGLQADLQTVGFYNGPIDGRYGPETVAAVVALQREARLPETGFMDPATEVALDERLDAAGATQTLHVAALQGALTAAGYYEGRIDGLWSGEVEAALKSLQADQAQETTAVTDPATLAALVTAIAIQTQQGPTTTTAPPTTAPAQEPTTTVP